MRKALITGVNGMDGSLLAEFLLLKNYEVHGVIRRSSVNNTWRIDGILDKIHLHTGDMTDSSSLRQIAYLVQPDEVYNLAAQSFVGDSFNVAIYTADADGLGCLRLLEAIKDIPNVRFYQASTSELFGITPPPQSESTKFHPASPYGVAKLFAFYSTVNFREAYGMHASNGILFNHEHFRRSENFVSKKICKGLVRCKNGLQDHLTLGNLEAKRDWGFSEDFIRGMWMILQQEIPSDYVLATGESHSIREFLNAAGDYLNIDWKRYVVISSEHYRPLEVNHLLGDASRARDILGWKPQVKFSQLIKIMIDAELNDKNNS